MEYRENFAEIYNYTKPIIVNRTMALKKQKQDWDELGKMDPFYAILSDPKRKFGKWDIKEFFFLGEQELEKVMEFGSHVGYPMGRKSALDFGCGVGRLTRALAKYFQETCGVDISENMIKKAKELNRAFPNCSFILNTEEHLQIFPDDHFDMIYTNIVLQHISEKSVIRSYISEFIRILKEEGLLVFQLPSYIPLKNRLQPRSRLYTMLRTLGFDDRFLYNKLGLLPMRMNFIPEKEVVALLNHVGGKTLEIQSALDIGPYIGPSIENRIYYVTK